MIVLIPSLSFSAKLTAVLSERVKKHITITSKEQGLTLLFVDVFYQLQNILAFFIFVFEGVGNAEAYELSETADISITSFSHSP